MHIGAVGIKVFNNYIHDYGFAGIRCGDFISQQGDCMLTNIKRNLVINPQVNVSIPGDTGGIYYNTHWLNPSE